MPDRFDVDAARRDLGAFCVMVGRPLAPWQLASLRLETLIGVLLARGAGKSTSLALLAAWRAFVHGGTGC